MVTVKKDGTRTRMPGDRRYNPTPGPWRVNSGMVETETGIPIAYMDRNPGNGTVPTERDSNAYLIATAPELLAQLATSTDNLALAHDELCAEGRGLSIDLCPCLLAKNWQHNQAVIAKADKYNAS